MEHTFQKVGLFGVFIVVGFLLKAKFTSKAEIQGLKKIILNIALPATIFIALMGVEISYRFLSYPLIALGINLVLFWLLPILLPVLGFSKNTPENRTLKIMLPSLAPGLSCFPFIAELLEAQYLAKAAMADLGNKVFVLIILYSIAMQWHYKRQNNQQPRNTRFKSLLTTLISEPVSVIILVALVAIGIGYSFENLPFMVQQFFEKMSLLMTPLVMLFIGLAVNIKKQQFFQLSALLAIRAGLVMILIALFVWISGIHVTQEAIWILTFGLSACSFWPYAHIANVHQKEQNLTENKKTFNDALAVNILALSFPFSTMLIIGVMLNQEYIAIPSHMIIVGIVLMSIGITPIIIKRRKLLKLKPLKMLIKKTRSKDLHQIS